MKIKCIKDVMLDDDENIQCFTSGKIYQIKKRVKR